MRARAQFVAGLRMQALLVASVPFNYVPAVVQPAVYLIVMGRAHSLDQPATADHLVVATGLLAIWGTTIWTCGMMLRWDAATGVLTNVLTTRATLWLVLLGRGVGAGCFSVVAVFVSLAVTAFASGARLSAAVFGQAIIAAPLAIVSAATLGLLFSSGLIASRRALRNLEIFTYPFFIISGLLIPAALLPGPLKYAWTVVSLQWINRLLDEVAAHNLGQAEIAGCMYLLLVGAYAVIGVLVLQRVLGRLRRTGTVDHV
jgi:ABC-2 type transport system permease protein